MHLASALARMPYREPLELNPEDTTTPANDSSPRRRCTTPALLEAQPHLDFGASERPHYADNYDFEGGTPPRPVTNAPFGSGGSRLLSGVDYGKRTRTKRALATTHHENKSTLDNRQQSRDAGIERAQASGLNRETGGPFALRAELPLVSGSRHEIFLCWPRGTGSRLTGLAQSGVAILMSMHPAEHMRPPGRFCLGRGKIPWRPW